MAHGNRTVSTGERNKGLSLTFQPPEEDRSVQHGDKDEDNSPKNVNNVHNTSSQKYRQSGPGSDGNKEVLCIPQSSSITRV